MNKRMLTTSVSDLIVSAGYARDWKIPTVTRKAKSVQLVCRKLNVYGTPALQTCRHIFWAGGSSENDLTLAASSCKQSYHNIPQRTSITKVRQKLVRCCILTEQSKTKRFTVIRCFVNGAQDAGRWVLACCRPSSIA